MRLYLITLFFIIFILSETVLASASVPAVSKAPEISLKKFPFYFEENVGQHTNEINFVAQSPNAKFLFLNDRVEIKLNKNGSDTNKQITLRFKNTNKSVAISGEKKTTAKVNYLRGSKTQWRSNINTFSQVRYSEIYSGVDLVFYFNDFRLEYDFIVQAKIDPSVIQFDYSNNAETKIENDEIVIASGNQSIIQKAPIIYQMINGQKKLINGNYQKNNNNYRFNIAKYDVEKPLIIDPVIEFSSYFGGQWEDYASNVVTDSLGNIYVAGSTSARARITLDSFMMLENTAMPAQAVVENTTSSHFFDGEIGLALSSEYLGLDGSKIDLIKGEKITVVDDIEQREIFDYQCKFDYRYLGFFGRDFLATDYDAFISKYQYIPVDPLATPIVYQLILEYTTYFGGCRNDGIRDMVVDANDNLYVAGFTLSDNIPIKNQSQPNIGASRFPSAPRQSDAFYAKFDSSGSLVYSSYFGGDGRDGVRAIAVDSVGALYMTGYTHSTNLTACPDTGVNVIQCEQLGGVELISENGEVSYYSDAFVTKITPDGQAREFINYFGGSLDDWGQSIVVDEIGVSDTNGNIIIEPGIYIAGNTSSTDLLSPNVGYSYMSYRQNDKKCSRINNADVAIAKDLHFCEDAFVSKISLEGDQIIFSTYLGGIFDDAVSEMMLDSQRNIYLAGTSRSQATNLATGVALEFTVPPNLSEEETAIKQNIKNYHEVRFPLFKHIDKFTRKGMFNELDIPKPIIEPIPIASVAFLTIFKPNAEALLLSTFIGGSDDDSGIGLTLNQISDDEVDVYLGGHTLSKDFFTQNAFKSTISNSDIFIVSLKLDLLNKDAPFGKDTNCSSTSCNLYSLNYSTLLGGEGLDALKDISFSGFDNQLFLAGTTYSKLFPVTDNALKTSIDEVFLRDYHPRTREIQFESSYFPSDIFLIKMSDQNTVTNLNLTVIQNNSGTVRAGDKLSFEIDLQNSSNAIDAKSVRLHVGYPYIASNEKMSKYVTVIGASNCEIEFNQIYCLTGDILAGENQRISIEIEPRSTGSFPVSFALSSQTANDDAANTMEIRTVQIRSNPNTGAVGVFVVSFLMLLMLLFRNKLKLIRFSDA